MKHLMGKILIYAFVFFLFLNSGGIGEAQQAGPPPEIYSRHWPGPLPVLPSDSDNPLLIHDVFVILFDREKSFPVYLAYRLNPNVIWGELKTERKYIRDPLLPPPMGLSADDYKGAGRCDGRGMGYDRGHLAPRSAFKGTRFASQAQYLSNIVPQRRRLNQGPWNKLDLLIKDFVTSGQEAWIITGPVYGQAGEDKTPPCWRAAQGKITEIPTGYWKIVIWALSRSRIELCSFLMPQSAGKNTKPEAYTVPLSHIEGRLGRGLFPGMENIREDCRFLLR